eukprot:752520-Hanusia_phi.AAC.1
MSSFQISSRVNGDLSWPFYIGSYVICSNAPGLSRFPPATISHRRRTNPYQLQATWQETWRPWFQVAKIGLTSSQEIKHDLSLMSSSPLRESHLGSNKNTSSTLKSRLNVDSIPTEPGHVAPTIESTLGIKPGKVSLLEPDILLPKDNKLLEVSERTLTPRHLISSHRQVDAARRIESQRRPDSQSPILASVDPFVTTFQNGHGTTHDGKAVFERHRSPSPIHQDDLMTAYRHPAPAAAARGISSVPKLNIPSLSQPLTAAVDAHEEAAGRSLQLQEPLEQQGGDERPGELEADPRHLDRSADDMEITSTARTYPSENGDDAEGFGSSEQKLSASQMDPELEHLQSESHVKELTEMFTKVMSVNAQKTEEALHSHRHERQDELSIEDLQVEVKEPLRQEVEQRTPPSSSQAEPVGVLLTLEENHDSLLSSPAKRQQMEKLIKEDVAFALRVPLTRVQIVKLQRGRSSADKKFSIVAQMNILPNEREGFGPFPSDLADSLIQQVSESMSRLHRAMSTRRASEASKCAAFSLDGTSSNVLHNLRPLPESAEEAQMDEPEEAHPPAVTKLSTEQQVSISDRMAMFRAMEQKGVVPQPVQVRAQGPHFSAPKAALQAHVQREEKMRQETHRTSSADDSQTYVEKRSPIAADEEKNEKQSPGESLLSPIRSETLDEAQTQGDVDSFCSLCLPCTSCLFSRCCFPSHLGFSPCLRLILPAALEERLKSPFGVVLRRVKSNSPSPEGEDTSAEENIEHFQGMGTVERRDSLDLEPVAERVEERREEVEHKEEMEQEEETEKMEVEDAPSPVFDKMEEDVPGKSPLVVQNLQEDEEEHALHPDLEGKSILEMLELFNSPRKEKELEETQDREPELETYDLGGIIDTNEEEKQEEGGEAERIALHFDGETSEGHEMRDEEEHDQSFNKDVMEEESVLNMQDESILSKTELDESKMDMSLDQDCVENLPEQIPQSRFTLLSPFSSQVEGEEDVGAPQSDEMMEQEAEERREDMPVGIEMVLAEEFDDVITSQEEANAFKTLLRSDLASLLFIPVERVEVVSVHRGSIIAHVNLVPGGVSSVVCDELAEILIGMLHDEGSSIWQTYSMKKVIKIFKVDAFSAEEDEESFAAAPSSARAVPEILEEVARAGQAAPVESLSPQLKEEVSPRCIITEEPSDVVARTVNAAQRFTSFIPSMRVDEYSMRIDMWSWMWVGIGLSSLRGGSAAFQECMARNNFWCSSAAAHERVHEILWNRRLSSGAKVEEEDVRYILTGGMMRSMSILVRIVMWMALTLVGVVVCIREFYLWLLDCEAFASRASAELCFKQETHAQRGTDEGIVILVGCVFCFLFQLLAAHSYSCNVSNSAMDSAAGLMSYIYNKALTSNQFCGASQSDQENINACNLTELLINDVSTLSATTRAHFLLQASILMCLFSIGLIAREVEVGAIGGLTALALFLLLHLLSFLLVNRRKEQQREQLTTPRLVEMLGILKDWVQAKILQLQNILIADLTSYIQNDIMSSTITSAIEFLFSSILPVSASLVTSSAMVLIAYVEKRSISNFEVFMVLCISACMQVPLYLYSSISRSSENFQHSLARVVQFLNHDDRPKVVDHKNKKKDDVCVSTRQSMFFWPNKSSLEHNFYLGSMTDTINFDIPRGHLVGVSGATKCGKSSLLRALSGWMPRYGQTGYMHVYGEAVFCCRQPQLLAGTIKQNILFGLPLDHNMYTKAMACSGLVRFVQMLPAGDETVIGTSASIALDETFVRCMSLARAVYRDVQVYFFDDIFDRLDEQVSDFVWQNCILGQLKAKTVIVSLSLNSRFLSHCNSFLFVSASKQGLDTIARVEALASLAELRVRAEEWQEKHQLDIVDLSDRACVPSWLVPDVGVLYPRMAMSESGSQWLWAVFCSLSEQYVSLSIILVFAVCAHLVCGLQNWILLHMDSSFSGLDVLNRKPEDIVIVLLVCCGLAYVLILVCDVTWFVQVASSASIRLQNKFLNLFQKGPTELKTVVQVMTFQLTCKYMQESVEEYPVYLLHSLHSTLSVLSSLVLLTYPLCSFTGHAQTSSFGDSKLVFLFFIAPLISACGWIWNTIHGMNGMRTVCTASMEYRSNLEAICSSTANSLTQITMSASHSSALLSLQNVLDKYSSSRKAMACLQSWSVLCSSLICCLLLSAALLVLLLLKQMGALTDTNGFSLAGLVLASSVQLILYVPWMTFCFLESAVVYHLFIRRLLEAEELYPTEEKPLSRALQVLPQSWSTPEAGSILFQDVSTIDEYGMKELEGMTLDVRAGSRVLLLSRRAEDLKAVARCMLKTSQIIQGSLFLGAADSVAVSLDAVRKHVGLVPREPLLFKGSLTFNVDPTEEMMSKQEGQHNLLTLLKFVGIVPREHQQMPASFVNNDLTSSDPRQRFLMGLARVLLRRPQILVIEEAACVLPLEEINRLDSLFDGQRNLTVLHLSSTPMRCSKFERVVVMRQRRVCEDGSPLQLLAVGSELKSMLAGVGLQWSRQEQEQVEQQASSDATPMMSLHSSRARDPAMGMAPAPVVAPTPTQAQSLARAPAPAAVPAGGGSVSPGSKGRVTLDEGEEEMLRRLRRLDESYSFDLIRSCIAAVHEKLLLDAESDSQLSSQVVTWRGTVMKDLDGGLEAHKLNKIREVLELCCRREVEDVASLVGEPSMLVYILARLLRGLPRPLISPGFLAQAQSKETGSMQARIRKLSDAVQNLLTEEGEYLELFVQVAWLLSLIQGNCGGAYDAASLAQRITPFLINTNLGPAQRMLALFISHYDQILEGQVTYGEEEGQQSLEGPAPAHSPAHPAAAEPLQQQFPVESAPLPASPPAAAPLPPSPPAAVAAPPAPLPTSPAGGERPSLHKALESGDAQVRSRSYC